MVEAEPVVISLEVIEADEFAGEKEYEERKHCQGLIFGYSTVKK